MSCNCKTLNKKKDVNVKNIADGAKIYANWRFKLAVTLLFILMSPVLITKYVVRKWKKAIE